MYCRNCGKKLNEGVSLCDDCENNIAEIPINQKNDSPTKRMPGWLKIILVILWVIVFALSMQIRKQFIVGGLVGFIHAGLFLYLLRLIIKR